MDNNCSLNLAIIPKELTFLLEIMKKENCNSNTFNKEWFTDLDWELFLELAKYHRIYPLIYSRLIKGDKYIPSYVIQTLGHEYKKNTFQMLQLTGEMEHLSKLFSENQIRLLFLKGPVIAADIFGDISLRTSKDLDILIPKTDLIKAEELLLSMGYVRLKTPANFDEWKWREYHITYYHTKTRIQIEIHWRLHPPPTKEPSFNELWERKRISNLTSYPVYFFGKEDLFLYLVAHGAKHGWSRLRWLADIDQIIRNEIICEKRNLLLKKYQRKHLGEQAIHLRGQALNLASQLFNTPLNEDMKTITAGKRSRKLAQFAMFYLIEKSPLQINQSKDSKDKNKHGFSIIKSNLRKSFLVHRYQFSVKSNLEKFIFIIKLLSPSSADAETLRLPKSLYLIYFPLRPFLWACRKKRRIE